MQRKQHRHWFLFGCVVGSIIIDATIWSMGFFAKNFFEILIYIHYPATLFYWNVVAPIFLFGDEFGVGPTMLFGSVQFAVFGLMVGIILEKIISFFAVRLTSANN